MAPKYEDIIIEKTGQIGIIKVGSPFSRCSESFADCLIV